MAEAALDDEDDNEDEAAKTAARSDSAKSSDRRGHGTRSAAGSVTARPNKSDEFGADDEDDMAGDRDGDPARCVHSRMISALDTPSSVDSEAALASTAISAVAGGDAAPTESVATESAGSKADDEDDTVDSDDDAIRTIMPHGRMFASDLKVRDAAAVASRNETKVALRIVTAAPAGAMGMCTARKSTAGGERAEIAERSGSNEA